MKADHISSKIRHPQDAFERIGLRVLNALSELFRPVLKEYLIGILRVLRPAHPPTAFRAESTSQFSLESSAGWITVYGQDDLLEGHQRDRAIR